MPRNNQNNRGRNNNPEGRNQYSNGMMDIARERPLAAAATAAGAVAAGVFLWSKRNQISDQLSNLSDQIGAWTDTMRSENREFETVGGDTSFSGSSGTSASADTGSSNIVSGAGRAGSGSRKSASSGGAG